MYSLQPYIHNIERLIIIMHIKCYDLFGMFVYIIFAYFSRGLFFSFSSFKLNSMAANIKLCERTEDFHVTF